MRPYRFGWSKLSDRAQCEIARRVRTMGVSRAAKSLHVCVTTIESLINGGTARAETVSRIEASVKSTTEASAS